VLLTAYTPTWLPDAQWGGRVAIPSIRSADDETSAWPTAGRFASIRHAYDEVTAAVRWLRADGATWVAGYGVSHGALVLAGALAGRPDGFDAVACHVPLTDMLRHPILADGWMTGDNGDPREPGHADWLTRTSPYHQVTERPHPPVLRSTGLRDSRVHPAHAAKLAAALQWGLPRPPHGRPGRRARRGQAARREGPRAGGPGGVPLATRPGRVAHQEHAEVARRRRSCTRRAPPEGHLVAAAVLPSRSPEGGP
jgi:hypothetical protein